MNTPEKSEQFLADLHITTKVEVRLMAVGYPWAIFLSLVIPESLLCFTLQYKRCLCGSHLASRKPAGKSEDSTKIPPFPVLLTVQMLSLFSSCLAAGHSPRLTLWQRQNAIHGLKIGALVLGNHLADRCFCLPVSTTIAFSPTNSYPRKCVALLQRRKGGNPQKFKNILNAWGCEFPTCWLMVSGGCACTSRYGWEPDCRGCFM